jgi:hypothetical protein
MLKVPTRALRWLVFNPSRPKESLLGKRIYLRLDLNHFGYTERLKQEFLERAAHIGYPWTGAISTSAVAIDIPQTPESPECVAPHFQDGLEAGGVRKVQPMIPQGIVFAN